MAKERESWIESSDVIPMFPSLVWKIGIRPALTQAIDAGILAALEDLRRDLPRLRPGEGWQSDQTLHERQELQDLARCIHNGALSVLRFLKIGYDAIEITGCWANVLAPGAAHRRHMHPNNYLSGAYYVRTGRGSDTINFHDPRAQTAVIRPPATELTGENTDQVVVNVSNGTLLLFPAYLEHSVDSNTSDEERVSVSFNVMFSSFTEQLAKPLW